MSPHAVFRLLLVCGTLGLSGCTSQDPLSSDSKIAARQVTVLFPKGTSEARAKRIFHDKGFTLSRLDSQPAMDHLLVGTCSRGKYTWLVGVVIVEGRVVASSVTVTKS